MLPRKREFELLTPFWGPGAVRRQMKDLLGLFGTEDFWPLGETTSKKLTEFTPKLDAHEDEEKLTVTVELPGMKEKDFEISVAEDTLYLKGEKKFERKESKNGQSYVERSYGAFERAIPLSFKVDEDQPIDAVYRDGILTIQVPKSDQAQKGTRKIAVKAG